MSSNLIFLYLEFDKARQVKGESTFEQFQGHIELRDFKWGMKFAGEAKMANNKVKRRIAYEHIKLTKSFDASSVLLLNCMRTHDRLETARITIAHRVHEGAGDGQLRQTMVTVLNDAYITNINLDMNESGNEVFLQEDIEIAFRSVKVDYYPPSYGAGGKREGALSFQSHLDTADVDLSGMADLFGE